MILPIEIYNNPILNKKCKDINLCYPNLEKLIFNMFHTMYNANGIGLAAPQIGLNIRLFIIDVTIKNDRKNKRYKKVFINPKIIDKYGKNDILREGCLSIPSILENVVRKSNILIEYYDENWKKKIKMVNGILSRVIQHEYDHIEGILFIDLLSPIKKRLIKNKLKFIKKGRINIYYPYNIFNKKYFK